MPRANGIYGIIGTFQHLSGVRMRLSLYVQEASNAKVGCLQWLFKFYFGEFTHTVKRPSHPGLRWKTSRFTIEVQARRKFQRFLRGLLPSLRDCLDQHITHTWTVISNYGSIIIKTLHKFGEELNNIARGFFGRPDSPSDVTFDSPSKDLPLLPFIDTVSDGDPSALPLADKTRPTGFLLSNEDFNTLPKPPTRSCMMRTVLNQCITNETFRDDISTVAITS